MPVEPTPSPSVVSTTQAAAVQPQPSPLVNKKSSRPGTDSTAITVISIPQANASVVQSMAARISSDNLKPSTANKISESSSKSPVDKSLKEYPSKINIAQLYKPPTLVKVPDSVHAAPEWHEKCKFCALKFYSRNESCIHNINMLNVSMFFFFRHTETMHSREGGKTKNARGCLRNKSDILGNPNYSLSVSQKLSVSVKNSILNTSIS